MMDSVSTTWMSNFGAFGMFEHATQTLRNTALSRGIKADGVILEFSPTGEMLGFFFNGDATDHTIASDFDVTDGEYAAANLLMTAITYHTQAIEDAYAGPMIATMVGTVLELAKDIESKLGVKTPEGVACGEKLVVTF